jgi:transcriptional regulator with XRE-family HTH domain
VRPVNPAQVQRVVGRRVAELWVLRGMTQERFAESLVVSVQYLRRIELAQTHVTIPKLVELANALRVPPAALLEKPQSMQVRRGRLVTSSKTSAKRREQ